MKTWNWIIFAVIVIGGGGTYWWNQRSSSTQNPVYQEQTNAPTATNQRTDNTNQAPAAQPATQNQTPGESVAGYYAHNDNPKDGYILISQSGNTIVLKGYAEETSAYEVTHYGALHASTVVDNDGRATVDLSPNHDGSCKMTLTFNTSSGSPSVKVYQTTSGLQCGFGQNVSYFGTYNKKSSVPNNLPSAPQG